MNHRSASASFTNHDSPPFVVAVTAITIIPSLLGHYHSALATTNHHYQPLSTTTNHYQPFTTTINHFQPLSTIIWQSLHPITITNQPPGVPPGCAALPGSGAGRLRSWHGPSAACAATMSEASIRNEKLMDADGCWWWIHGEFVKERFIDGC